MMKRFPKNLCAVTLAALTFYQLGPFCGVDALWENSIGVECLTETRDVCVGEKVIMGPSPVQVSCEDPYDTTTCVTDYQGNYELSWDLIDVLEDTELDYDDYQTIQDAKTGVAIRLVFDYEEGTCGINIGTSRCSTCSICTSTPDPSGFFYYSMEVTTITYDCTNLENGKSSGGQCEAVASPDPFFYPFAIPTNQSIADNISEEEYLNMTLGLDYEEDENLVGSTAEDPLKVDPNASSIVEDPLDVDPEDAEEEDSNAFPSIPSLITDSSTGLSSPLDHLNGNLRDTQKKINLSNQDEGSLVGDLLDVVHERVGNSITNLGPSTIDNLANSLQNRIGGLPTNSSDSGPSTGDAPDVAVQDLKINAPDGMETAFLSAADVGVTRGIFSRTITLVLGFAVFNMSL